MFSDAHNTSIRYASQNRASMKYLKAFIDLDAVTVLVLQASEINLYWDPKEQSTKRHTSAEHWRGTVVLESK